MLIKMSRGEGYAIIRAIEKEQLAINRKYFLHDLYPETAERIKERLDDLSRVKSRIEDSIEKE